MNFRKICRRKINILPKKTHNYRKKKKNLKLFFSINPKWKILFKECKKSWIG